MPTPNLLVATAQLKPKPVLVACCLAALLGATVYTWQEWPKWDPPVDPQTGLKERFWLITCTMRMRGGSYGWKMWDYCFEFLTAQKETEFLFAVTAVKHAVVWLACAAFAKLTSLMVLESVYSFQKPVPDIIDDVIAALRENPALGEVTRYNGAIHVARKPAIAAECAPSGDGPPDVTYINEVIAAVDRNAAIRAST